MFGNQAVTSTWGNPQQNQPPQQQGASAFGQPATTGFGTGGFGAGNAFGQNPQPQANPMFGNLANPSSTTGGFGTFGGAASGSTANPLFGGTKPATGFGAFGGAAGTSTFGGGGTFGGAAGNAAGSSSVFGQPAGTSGFGANTGSNLFGKTLTTGFGNTQTSAQSGGFDGVTPVTTGTASPPFSEYTEKDNSNTLRYQSISCMSHYRGSSFEELRVQDYAQGRKTAGGFGQSAAFGSAATTTQPSSLFGGSAQQPSTQPTNPLFGGPTNPSGGAFGAFGTSATQPTTTTGTGMFGSFGQPQQQQQQQQQASTGFGGFGQAAQQPQAQTGTGIFGGGGFGANKPSTFGPFSGGGGGFGTGTFGSQPQQQPQQPAATGSLFGQQQTQGGAFSGFGANANANKPSIFGNQPATQPSTFGSFGQPQNQGQQQPAGSLFSGGSLFGNQLQTQTQTQPTQPTGGGLFGGNQTTQPGGLFGPGGGGGGGGLFGNAAQPQATAQQPQNSFSNLFNKPANAPATTGGGLFGTQGPTLGISTSGQQGSLFGNPPANQQQSSGSAFGGLFGKPALPAGQMQSTTGQPGGTSLWGNTLGANSFNSSGNAPGTQGTLAASISEPIASNLSIFSMLPPGPRAVALDQTKKKPSYFVDVPTRSPVPRLQLGYTPASSKLRGFGSSTTSSLGTSGNPFAGLSLAAGKTNVLSLNRGTDGKTSTGVDGLLGRSASPSLGSGGRQSVKKLILDKKVEPSDLFSKSGSSQKPGGKITFNPALSIAAREKEAAAAASSTVSTESSKPPASRTQRPASRSVDKKGEASGPSAKESELQEGDYWVKPDLETLKGASYEELVSFKGLVVGRVGYGEIHFLDPVDLTGLPKLSALLGEIVRFDEKECSVYPDYDDVDKPSPQSGLNVRGKVILVRCWTQDKATREPIKDEKNPLAVRHLKRLKGMKDTHFESWVMETGQWTFTVDHF